LITTLMNRSEYLDAGCEFSLSRMMRHICQVIGERENRIIWEAKKH
jgi:hypothetical protein